MKLSHTNFHRGRGGKTGQLRDVKLPKQREIVPKPQGKGRGRGVTIGPSCSGINLKVNLRGKMVGSTAETTVNRGETIKDREKARSEARGGSETDKGEVEGQEGNKYIVKRVEFGS